MQLLHSISLKIWFILRKSLQQIWNYTCSTFDHDANWYLTKLLLILILQNQRLPMTQSVQPGLNNLLPVPLVRTAILLTKECLVYLNPSDLEKSLNRPNFGNKRRVSDKSYVLAWNLLLVLFRYARKLEIYDENEDNPILPY